MSFLNSGVEVLEASQVLLHETLEENKAFYKTRLKRKLRNMKEDLEERIRDYNSAMTTFASDMRILRQEVQQNINNVKVDDYYIIFQRIPILIRKIRRFCCLK